jgi:macrolide transport system ATP-binding/permease protein
VKDPAVLSPATPVAELRGLCRTYRGPIAAVRGVDLTIHQGEYVALSGPSGSGKSTLVNLLGLLDRPDDGSYFFEGIDTTRVSDAELAALRAERIGIVFQDFHLLPYRSATENVALGLLYRGIRRPERYKLARAALDRVGLRHRLEALPLTLSGGERQRVAIARALVGEPALLLCDEPTGNLDSAATSSLLDVIDHLHESGLTVMVITHDQQVAARAERRLSMRDGRVEADTAAGAMPQPPVPSWHRHHVTVAAENALELDQAVSEPRHVRRSTASWQETAGIMRYGGVGSARASLTFRSRLRSSDLALEVSAGIVQRPGRTILTMLGTMLGIGTLVTVLGLTSTAAGQIGHQFSALNATEAIATYNGPPASIGGFLNPSATLVQLRTHGLVQAGIYWQVANSVAPVDVSTAPDSTSGLGAGLDVYGTSPDLLSAIDAKVTSGVLFNSYYENAKQPVALLGAVAAQNLGITTTATQPAIFLNGTPYAVVGVLARNVQLPQLDLAVIIPASTALAQFGPPGSGSPAQIFLHTRLGAAPQVASQAPLALDPEHPDWFSAAAAPNSTALAAGIDSTITRLLLSLAAVAVVVGAFGIANTTLVAVMERTSEIGLRRALGALRRHIASQFLAESAGIGLIGGLIGTAIGVGIVVAVAILRQWTAVLSPVEVFVPPLGGAVVGLFAGAYPAWRSSRIEPATTLRR